MSSGKTHRIVVNTELPKIHDPAFRCSKPTSQDDSLAFKTTDDGHDDITTGVMSWIPMDSDDIGSESASKRPAIEVCLRPFETGLGGHDEGVFWVDAGVENASLPLWKRVRMSWSECATFSGFTGVEKDSVGDGCNRKQVSYRRRSAVITRCLTGPVSADHSKNCRKMSHRFSRLRRRSFLL